MSSTCKMVIGGAAVLLSKLFLEWHKMQNKVMAPPAVSLGIRALSFSEPIFSRSRSPNRRSINAWLSIALSLSFLALGAPVCMAEEESVPLGLPLIGFMAPVVSVELGDGGIYGSLTVSNSAKVAAKALKSGDWSGAQAEYKKLVCLQPKQEDFYFGLYKASHALKQWDQCALALKGLMELRPTYRDKLLFEYGESLYQMNRFDDAELFFKEALAKPSGSIIEKRIAQIIEKALFEPAPTPGTYKILPTLPPPVEPSYKPPTVANDKDELNYEAAFMRSESIAIAEYKGYDQSDDIGFYSPPRAHFKVLKVLKGYLHSSLPVRYEFHQKIKNEQKPSDWKFGEDLMPRKNSKWILFVPNAVATDGMFDTYHGSYGRQECTDENLDKLMQIIDQHKGQTK